MPQTLDSCTNLTHQNRAVTDCYAPSPSDERKEGLTPCVKLPRYGGTPMLDPKMLEDFGAKMSALLANTPARDIEKNAKAMLSGFFGKLDLVTREEFDVQAQVLARTREKLQALEARVDALEKARSGQ